MNGATGLGGSEDHDGVERQRQWTPSLTAAATDGDGDVDGKAETSTTELDRPTTSLLHGAASSGNEGRVCRCHCCAVQ